MALSGISAPAEQRLAISNEWLDENKENKNAVCDTQKMTPKAAFASTNIPVTGMAGSFEPRGVSLTGQFDNSKDNNVNDTVAWAYINCRYKNDSRPYREPFATRITHPARVRFIHAKGTTARGIFIKA